MTASLRDGVRWAARQVVRVLPVPWLTSTIDRVAPAWARLALDSRWLPPHRRLGEFLRDIAALGPAPLTAPARRRLAGERLAFILQRLVVHLVVEAVPLARAHERLQPIAVEGIHHLEAALAPGRGAVLVTGHFGFPLVARVVLTVRDIDVVAVGAETVWVDELIGGDVWERARLLHRLRARLRGRRVCFFLPDIPVLGGPPVRHVPTPLLGGQQHILIGAFTLARQTRCPVLPVFGVRSPRAGGFAVEFGAPRSAPEGSAATWDVDAAREFGAILDGYARRFPHHLFGYT